MAELDPEHLRRIQALTDRLLPGGGVGPARLDGASDDELRLTLADATAPRVDRLSALEEIARRLRRERSLTAVLRPLLEDADDDVVAAAIRALPPFDPEAVALLRATADDPRLGHCLPAAEILARRKDPSILGRLLLWLREGDDRRFSVALDGLPFLLDADDYRTVLDRAWDLRAGCEELQQRLAARMIELDDVAEEDV